MDGEKQKFNSFSTCFCEQKSVESQNGNIDFIIHKPCGEMQLPDHTFRVKHIQLCCLININQ